MAVVYRCDRCKLIGETSDYLTDVVLPASAAVFTEDKTAAIVPAVDSRTFGLCRDCLTKARDFMEAA